MAEFRERLGRAMATPIEFVAKGGGGGIGFLGAAFVGRQIENIVMGKDAAGTQKYVAATDTFTTKLKAGLANDIPKLGLWWLTRDYASARETGVGLVDKAVTSGHDAIAGSAVFDGLLRLMNKGVPPRFTIRGYDILSGEHVDTGVGQGQATNQGLVQENTALRGELNKALVRLSDMARAQQAMVQAQQTPAQITPPPPPPVVQVYPINQPAQPPVTVQTPPEISERERKYGFMQHEQTPPVVQDRERKFGFMKGAGPSGEERDIASMFGML